MPLVKLPEFNKYATKIFNKGSDLSPSEVPSLKIVKLVKEPQV